MFKIETTKISDELVPEIPKCMFWEMFARLYPYIDHLRDAIAFKIETDLDYRSAIRNFPMHRRSKSYLPYDFAMARIDGPGYMIMVYLIEVRTMNVAGQIKYKLCVCDNMDQVIYMFEQLDKRHSIYEEMIIPRLTEVSVNFLNSKGTQVAGVLRPTVEKSLILKKTKSFNYVEKVFIPQNVMKNTEPLATWTEEFDFEIEVETEEVKDFSVMEFSQEERVQINKVECGNVSNQVRLSSVVNLKFKGEIKLKPEEINNVYVFKLNQVENLVKNNYYIRQFAKFILQNSVVSRKIGTGGYCYEILLKPLSKSLEPCPPLLDIISFQDWVEINKVNFDYSKKYLLGRQQGSNELHLAAHKDGVPLERVLREVMFQLTNPTGFSRKSDILFSIVFFFIKHYKNLELRSKVSLIALRRLKFLVGKHYNVRGVNTRMIESIDGYSSEIRGMNTQDTIKLKHREDFSFILENHLFVILQFLEVSRSDSVEAAMLEFVDCYDGAKELIETSKFLSWVNNPICKNCEWI